MQWDIPGEGTRWPQLGQVSGWLEALLDFYFVRPAKAQARRDALNARLAEAGKPQLKVPPTP
jgi:hypothetical protein